MLWLILAIVLWGVFHSLLASTGIKDLFRRAFGDGVMKFYRLFYNLYALISFLPILYLLLISQDKTLYEVSSPYGYIMRVGQGASVFFVVLIILQTGLLSFAGLRQLFEEEHNSTLIVNGFYRHTRHPLYLFTLLFFWLSPVMTINLLIVCIALTIYVFVGIFFEERKLIREYGSQYLEYRASTPMLIPWLLFVRNK